MTVRNLVFKGCGVQGFAYVGVVQALDDHGVLAGVERDEDLRTDGGILWSEPVALFTAVGRVLMGARGRRWTRLAGTLRSGAGRHPGDAR